MANLPYTIIGGVSFYLFLVPPTEAGIVCLLRPNTGGMVATNAAISLLHFTVRRLIKVFPQFSGEDQACICAGVMLFQKAFAHPAIYTNFVLSIIFKSEVWDVVVSYFRIGQFHNHFLSFVAVLLIAVTENAHFGVLTAFLSTATYHFATNKPQSCIVGGETTLYTITLGSEYCNCRRLNYRLMTGQKGREKYVEIAGKNYVRLS